MSARWAATTAWALRWRRRFGWCARRACPMRPTRCSPTSKASGTRSMAVVKQAVDAVAAVAPRVSLVLKARHPARPHRPAHREGAAESNATSAGRVVGRAPAARWPPTPRPAWRRPHRRHSATAWVTQWPRCSSSRPSATDCRALLTALIWVRTSMQYLSVARSSSRCRRTWPLDPAQPPGAVLLLRRITVCAQSFQPPSICFIWPISASAWCR